MNENYNLDKEVRNAWKIFQISRKPITRQRKHIPPFIQWDSAHSAYRERDDFRAAALKELGESEWFREVFKPTDAIDIFEYAGCLGDVEFAWRKRLEAVFSRMKRDNVVYDEDLDRVLRHPFTSQWTLFTLEAAKPGDSRLLYQVMLSMKPGDKLYFGSVFVYEPTKYTEKC